MNNTAPVRDSAAPQRVGAFLLLGLIAISARAADFPGTRWALATPAETGLNEAKLVQARDWKRTPGADHYEVLKPFLLPIAAAAAPTRTNPTTRIGIRHGRWTLNGRLTNPDAFTLCLQGGMPGYEGALNSAFEPDGGLRPAYLTRVERVIRACDRQGMAVILGLFYQRQSAIREEWRHSC